MARQEPRAVRITSASRGRSADIGARQRRYLISMAVRTACFVLAVLFRGEPVVMWAFILGSFVLPYVAVVAANAGVTPDPGGPDPFDTDPRRALGPPPAG